MRLSQRAAPGFQPSLARENDNLRATEGEKHEMKKRNQTLAVLLASAFAVVGCCDDGDGRESITDPGTEMSGTGGSATGQGNQGSVQNGSPAIEGTRKISSLSEQEVSAICGDLAESAVDATEGLCSLSGLFLEQLFGEEVTSCEEVRDECVADGAEDDCALEPDGCEASYAELRACLDEVEGGFAMVADVTCDSDLGALGEEQASPSCDALAQKCPNLFPEDEEETAEGAVAVEG